MTTKPPDQSLQPAGVQVCLARSRGGGVKLRSESPAAWLPASAGHGRFGVATWAGGLANFVSREAPLGTGETLPGTGEAPLGGGEGLPGSRKALLGTGKSLPGTGTALPGSGGTLPGSRKVQPGSGETLPGSRKVQPGTRN